MKNIDSGFQASLVGGRDNGLVPRTFFWATAKTFDTGAAVSIGLWTGDEDISISVISGTTGLPETRTYFGATNLVIGDIPRVSDMTIQTVTVTMSQIADAVQQLVRGYNIHLAKVEIHEMTLSTVSRQLDAPPEIAFLGQFDAAPIQTPSVGEEGNVTINVISDAISMLSRTNPAKSSYEGQKRRSNDQWGKYASTVATWNIPWGVKSN